jgi:cytochrome d ubiquinol oxidase subunit I
MAFGDVNARVRGIDEFAPQDRPPLLLTFVSFHVMIALGNFFLALMALAALRLLTGKIHGDRWLLRILVWSVPLPMVAIQLGWMAAEVGRQPWIVYKLLRTVDGASPAVSATQVRFSLFLLGATCLVLFVAWLYLMVRTARGAPVPDVTPREPQRELKVEAAPASHAA